MLLTIKQPVHHGYRSFHEYSPPTPPSSTSRFSPAVASSGPSLPPLSSTNKSLPPLPAPKASTPSMSTPHRGLPPPAGMTLPQPHQTHQPQQQQPPAPPLVQQPLNQPLGQLPAPPQQWHGAEESMRNWLLAKAEEDKRKQEEEKTRQESLRLEQRKIEQDMLKTSLSGGIPPYMIPMVFAGMGGGNLPNASLEWAQHYMAQAHHLQQQALQHQQQLLPPQGQTSPEQLPHQRNDARAIQHYAPQVPAPVTVPSTPIGPPQQNPPYQPNYQMSPASRARQSLPSQASLARQPQTTQLPRLNTGELHAQPPAAGPNMQIVPGQPTHPLQQTSSVQQETQSSPSIYFHHWQPPTTQASNTSGSIQPTTPSDHTSSPKKRKATGPQQAAPPPSSQPQYTSPQYSQTGSSVSNTPSSNNRRTRGHSRQRSDISSRGPDSFGRPTSRHHYTESGVSTRSTTSPPRDQIVEEAQASGTTSPGRPPSGGSHPLSSLLQSNDSQPATSQSRPQSRQAPRDTPKRYSAGPEMKHESQRPTPDEESPRREGGAAPKRDEGRE